MRVIEIDPWINRSLLAMVMDMALLWSTGRILHRRIRWRRLIISTLTGGIYQVVLGLRWEMGVIGMGDLLFYFMVGIGMVLLVYTPKSWRQAARSVFLFFLLTFITVGVSMGILSMAKVWGLLLRSSWQYIFVNLLILAVVVEIGWGAIHEAIWTQSCLVSLKMGLGGEDLAIRAFIDTGNQLKDPISRAPVVVVALSCIEQKIPKSLARIVRHVARGEPPQSEDEALWGDVLRFIPIKSVHYDSGYLVGIVPDYFELVQPSSPHEKNVVIAFTEQNFPEGEYQGIIPATLLQENTSALMRRQGHAAIN